MAIQRPPAASPSDERRSPIQVRSRERYDRIIDVTARLVDELGPDRVTTTLIAERAGISVGSIYSYFKHVSAIFDTIVARSITTLETHIRGIRARTDGGDFIESSLEVIDGVVHVYRTAPGFRALWFSQHVSSEMLATMRRSDEEQVRFNLNWLHASGRTLDFPDPLTALRMYVGLIDKGIDLAFRVDPDGDPQMVEETKRAVRHYLEPHIVPLTQPTKAQTAGKARLSTPATPAGTAAAPAPSTSSSTTSRPTKSAGRTRRT